MLEYYNLHTKFIGQVTVLTESSGCLASHLQANKNVFRSSIATVHFKTALLQLQDCTIQSVCKRLTARKITRGMASRLCSHKFNI